MGRFVGGMTRLRPSGGRDRPNIQKWLVCLLPIGAQGGGLWDGCVWVGVEGEKRTKIPFSGLSQGPTPPPCEISAYLI